MGTLVQSKISPADSLWDWVYADPLHICSHGPLRVSITDMVCDRVVKATDSDISELKSYL